MRVGIRTKEAVAVTVFTFLVVAIAALFHLAQLSRVVVQEVSRQGDLVAKQVYAQTSRALSRAPRASPADALRRDKELRSLLDASVGYSPHLIYALIADRTGKAILHTERAKEGQIAPAYPALTELAGLDPLRRFSALYGEGRIYEIPLPLLLDGAPFASIRLGVSTTLLRREILAGVEQSLILAGLALPLAWLVALGLAHRVLKRIRALGTEVDRLRRGELAAGAGIASGDEFQELSSQLQRLGQEIAADRIAALSERAHLQEVVDRLEDGVVLLGPARTVLFFNTAAEGVVGRPLDQAVGIPIDTLLPAAHPLRPFCCSDGAGGGARDATVVLTEHGRQKQFLVSVFPVGDGGRALGTVVLLKDLASVKVVQSLVSYSAKLAALGRLTSGVAHEVRNPLNAMMIHLELLREKLGDSPGDAQQSLEIIGSEIHRLDRVVQGFLRFMRPQEVSLKALDLNALLTSVGALLEAEWASRRIRFVWSLDAGLPSIDADEELLRQAFLNILQNACQAMPDGGAVAVRTERDGRDMIRVSIADEGVGIAPEDVDKIFKLYYTTKPDGTGIGLSIVYRVIQLHDGSIEARSEPGRGTTMIVGLPVR